MSSEEVNMIPECPKNIGRTMLIRRPAKILFFDGVIFIIQLSEKISILPTKKKSIKGSQRIFIDFLKNNSTIIILLVIIRL